MEVYRRGGRPAELLEVFDGLERAVADHFKDEERCMAERRFPELDRHKREHDAHLQEARGLRARMQEGGDAAEQTIEFMKEWLIKHTLTVDRRYREHLAGCGAE